MFCTQGNTQVYSPFGSFVVEQHDSGHFKRYIEDLPRSDLELGQNHPRARHGEDQR